jgi:Family of unknown function (DUF5995)
MFAYDDQILAAVQAAPQSIDDVIGTMQAIDAICSDGDGLKWFNWLYLGVTQAVGAQVDAGGFQDAAWMAALDVQFAELYFGALRSALSGGAAPRCWTVLLERRNWTALARIQCALAGVNAHINHDLPIAIVRTGAAPVHGDAHYSDYTALNSTLSTRIDGAKAPLHVRLLGDLLPPVSHLEDTMAAFSVTAAREAAWNRAEMFWALRALPELSARTADTLDGMTAVIGKTLLVPVV